MKLKGKDIVCVSFPNWEGEYMKTIVQIMTVLGKNNRVFYVDYAFTWKDILFYLLGKRDLHLKRVLGFSSRLRKEMIGENQFVYVFTPPPVFPINWINNPKTHTLFSKINSAIIGRSIQKSLKKIGITEPIVINAFNPFVGTDLVGKLNESLLVYYCYDEINAAPWSKKHGKRVEEQFLKQVDFVVTTSQGLLETKSIYNSSCYLVKNGVDYQLFSEGIALDEFKNQKVVGYVGSIDDRMDYELLNYCIEKLPDFTFLFVGRIMDESLIQELKKKENVTFVGSKLPKELPNYIASFDVGIIPFVKNEFTKNIYPLKINEYLAGGVGVVSTNFAVLTEFENMAIITDEHSLFVKAILENSQNQGEEVKEERQEMAKQNSWENRGDLLAKIIYDYQDSKK